MSETKAHEYCNDLECKATDGTTCKGGEGPRWGSEPIDYFLETEEQKTARLYYVHGYNDDSRTVWVVAQHLTVGEAHNKAAEMRERFPADKYMVKVQTHPDMNAVTGELP